MTRDVNSADCQYNLKRDEPDPEQDVFQLLFLHTEKMTVKAWETNFIECEILIHHLRAGESVFISPKKQNRSSTGCLDEEMKKPFAKLDDYGVRRKAPLKLKQMKRR